MFEIFNNLIVDGLRSLEGAQLRVVNDIFLTFFLLSVTSIFGRRKFLDVVGRRHGVGILHFIHPILELLEDVFDGIKIMMIFLGVLIEFIFQ